MTKGQMGRDNSAIDPVDSAPPQKQPAREQSAREQPARDQPTRDQDRAPPDPFRRLSDCRACRQLRSDVMVARLRLLGLNTVLAVILAVAACQPLPRPFQPEPDDPANPLGERWIGLGDRLSIHSTNNPSSIGKSDLPGCISLKPRDAEDVFDILSEGSKVVIRR